MQPAHLIISSISSLLRWPILIPLKQAVRHLQTLLYYSDFQRLKHLVASLPLGPLLARQPRFLHKYLSPYIAASFGPTARLAVLLHHYQFLKHQSGPAFFSAVAGHAVLWRDVHGPDVFTIFLAYPLRVGFEAELSLHFALNNTVLQVVGFVIAPGPVVGMASGPVLLFSQVQGTRDVGLLKHATKTLHEIPPAILLVNAAYGLMAALGIAQAAGVGTENQLSAGPTTYFDYTSFWHKLLGHQTTPGAPLQLPVPTPEKPIAQIASNHRGRNLRKRRYKQSIRETVEQQARATFGLAAPTAARTEAAQLAPVQLPGRSTPGNGLAPPLLFATEAGAHA